ncbi:hypothetical protein ACT17Q_14940 [Cellulomonas sp. CW35]|uniref:hypothetical protein n=1 Tax=Cellulomonas sp. CW35 TaxID=3458249 RepID=UPI0040345574
MLRPGGVGRPRGLRIDVFLAALVLTAGNKKSMSLTKVHELLTKDLARSYQTELGIRRDDRPLTIRQVRYVLAAIEAKLGHTGKWTTDRSDAEVQAREELLQRVLDELLAASIPESLPHYGLYAVDGSAISSAARGKRAAPPSGQTPSTGTKSGRRRKATPPTSQNQETLDDHALAELTDERGRSFDPDARWGYQTRTFDKGTNKCFGYQMVSFTRIQPVGQATEPRLTERIVVLPASRKVCPPSIATIDRLAADGKPVKEIVVDRGFSYGDADEWARPLRARGIEQVLDLHEKDQGVRDLDGVKIIAGTPHCPSMPDDLVKILRPAKLDPGRLRAGADKFEQAEHTRRIDELVEFRRRIAERQQYAFRRVAGPSPEGKERYECPAQAGKVICASCPVSQFLPKDRPTISDPPALESAPTACKQRTITITGDVTPKVRQRHYWGSDDWIRSMGRRSSVEGTFGNLKSAKTENVRRGWINVVGIVKTSLMLALAQVAANMRLVASWTRRTGEILEPTLGLNDDDFGFEELGPDGTIVGNAGPPTHT